MKFHHSILALLLLGNAPHSHAQGSSLEQEFKNPPVHTRPYVWWHWMGSNFSKEGITKDLKAMKASGIGGATIFNLASAVQESHKPTLNNPWPDQTYRSPKYWEAMKHTAAEAQRLGLEIGLHNTVGYSTTGGPWIDDERNMQNVATTSVTVDGGRKLEVALPNPEPVVYKGWGNTGLKFRWFRDIAVLAAPADGDIDPAKTIDLTTSFKDGRLTWDAPAGKWQVFRLLSVPTGASPHPVPDELIGKTLEADKMSLEQSRYHWSQVIDPMKQHLGPYLGKSFKHFLIDSYEAGPQNWTPAFRDEFKKRKGYDPLPWLLSLAQRTVGNSDMTNRFKWDHADVIRALYYENGWITARDHMKAVGMDLQFEPYGGPFDTTEGAALADLPMGEFWTGGAGSISSSVVSAARAGGRRVVGAEAFTGPPTLSKWTETPAFLKRSADGAFASGANRMILHHWVHQPFDDRYKPGMGMGWWGTHFNRHQTWAKDGIAFFQYLGRAQALLQAGETPSDFVSVGKSHGSDIASWREFRTGMTVRDGRIMLSSGRTYPFLVMGHDGRMLPEDVNRMTQLLEQGATIVCSKPSGSPSLAGYPASNDEIKSSTLWSGGDVRKIGKGKLYTKGDPNAAIRDFNITPAIRISGASGIGSTTRRTATESIHFLANTSTSTVSFTASLSVDGQRPELWDAADGSIRFAPVWRQKDGRTEVDLTLDSHRSIFVVFRSKEMPSDHVSSIKSNTSDADGVEILSARFGSATNNKWMDVTAKLRELSRSGALDIRSVHPGVFGKDPAPNVVKILELEFRLAGENRKLAVNENQPVKIGTPNPGPAYRIVRCQANGSIDLLAPKLLEAEVSFASGKSKRISLPAPATHEVKGPWDVKLVSPVDDTHNIRLASLTCLSTHADPAVKYFSGTATYRTRFPSPASGSAVVLDLGAVHDLARVTLNGKDLGVVWQAPFTVDLSSAIRKGENDLQIAVTNTWHNRLVGDEQHPADFEWGEDRQEKGHAMKAYPDWFIKNEARPESSRKGFVIWYYHRKDTPLVQSGLLGPVKIISHAPVTAAP
jgi:hypothetical protein